MTAPTIETVEERIIANVQSTLAAISPTHPTLAFWTQVRNVFRFDRDPALVALGEVPAITMVYESCTPSYDFAGAINYELALQLYLCVSCKDANWKRDLGRFAADVQRALRADPQRGSFADTGNAFDSNISEVRSANAPDPSPAVAMARVDLLVQFRHLATDPTLAV